MKEGEKKRGRRKIEERETERERERGGCEVKECRGREEEGEN